MCICCFFDTTYYTTNQHISHFFNKIQLYQRVEVNVMNKVLVRVIAMIAVSMMLVQPSEAANWGKAARTAGRLIKGAGKGKTTNTPKLGGAKRKDLPMYTTCGACNGRGQVMAGYNYNGQPVIHQCSQCSGTGRIWR